MKHLLLVGVLSLANMTMAFAKKLPELEPELIFTTYATMLVATDFCHSDTEAAREKAKNLCKQKGYRKDECGITVERIDSERVHEYAGEYSRGGAMYYKMSCTSKATLKITPTAKFEFKPYEALLPFEGAYTTKIISLFAELNQAVDPDENIFFSLHGASDKEIGDFSYYSAVVFSMSVQSHSHSKVINIGKVCVEQDFTRYLDDVKGIANRNFSLNLKYSKKSNIFSCGLGMVAVTGTIVINDIDEARY
jgi:hypothetical protein